MKQRLPVLITALLSGCALLFAGIDRCGDGVLSEGKESCDDGNQTSGDGCTDACLIEDGFVCPPIGGSCIQDTCGDGIVDAGEECDDGNLTDTDGCIECVAAVCGDGFIQQGVETCEPPSVGDCNAQCQLACQSPADCADNNACTINEDCVGNVCTADLLSVDDLDPCTADSCDPVLGVTHDPEPEGTVCSQSPRSICLVGSCVASACGDGFVDIGNGESCDDANASDTDSCPDLSGACVDAFCGDGFVQAGVEGCDDSNTISGDGCDSVCATEASVVDCAVSPSALVDALNAAASGSALEVINGALCNSALSVTILDKDISVSATGAPANVNEALTVQGTSNVSLKNIAFVAPVTVRNNGTLVMSGSTITVDASAAAFTIKDGGRGAIIGSTLSNTNQSLGAMAISCDQTPSQLLVDQSVLTGHQSDFVFELKNGCSAIIANSIFVDNQVQITIEMDKSIVSLVFSTFFNSGSGSIAGLAEVRGTTGILNADSIVGQDAGSDPVRTQQGGTAIFANSFIQGENSPGVTNTSPLLDINAHITSGTVLGQGNPNPDPAALPFDPATLVPGINIFTHDRNGAARPQGAPDPGAFEEPQ